MKTLDQIIIKLEGIWNFKFDELVAYEMTQPPKRLLISKSEFQQRAKELGFVGRYRWGVEYKTDGSIPDLPNDVLVNIEGFVAPINYIRAGSVNWSSTVSFKLVGDRFKPADTSYLDKPDSSTDNGADWYDYDNQEMKTLPDSNSDVELLCGGVYRARVEYIGIRGFKVVFYRYDTHEIDHAELPTASFRPLDHDRKAKAERKRVVDAAFHALGEQLMIGRKGFELAYDKGFLRLPD